ncbi:hypothetical protein [Piscinibacter sp. HJYY11]|uniref:hypothetical protein n=1 Tax=Piscinibacter sp. HJYY11 TaxID=2801333 RepID=UPI00191EED86|nr:hypothetical protein [Piscinibacter sp. HJYY11]MBL0730314.1 hypothetical protein [Piscinibacter sp. HJYY11]
MAIQIVPHSAEWRNAVEAFNERMRAGGSGWSFYVDPVPDWIPPRDGQNVWREYHLAVEDGEAVRGCFALKPQDWLINGQVQVVTDWQGPFSEGVIDPRHGMLGLRMIRDMLKKRPLLYSWGHGGDDQPVVQMLRKMNWLLHPTPFCLLVAKPFRFLRLNALLRQTPARRLLLDLGAWTGLGWLGLKLLHLGLKLRAGGGGFKSRAMEVPNFGPWADALWERCKGSYKAIAVRDAASMNALAPEGAWPPVTRLKVERDGQVIGWALVMDTRMQGEHRFGDLHVGSIVDTLALPSQAGEVVHAATRHLVAKGVDIVVSNQAHPEWAKGFAQNGYAVLPDKRLFAMSPQLQEALAPFTEVSKGLHLTNMDGHGPMAL